MRSCSRGRSRDIGPDLAPRGATNSEQLRETREGLGQREHANLLELERLISTAEQEATSRLLVAASAWTSSRR